MYQRIVVPLDGSDLAEQALTTAEALAQTTGAAVHLVRVVEFPPSTFTYAYGAMVESTALAAQLKADLRLASEYLEDVAKSITASGLTVTTEVRHGIAVPELIATTAPGDVFVIASHGRSGVARWFLGSVAEEFMRRATVPVLLVRATTSGHQSDLTGAALAV